MDIHSKETKHTTHDKATYLTKFHSAVQVKKRIQGTIHRIQDTKHRKQEHTQKQQNTKTRKKLLPGIEPRPSSL
jgi:hypothetical protein